MSQTILITGSSSGIGRGTAKYFQEQGWNVIATMRDPDHETELTKLERVFVTRLDVVDSASIKSAIEAGIAKFGRIDVLVNNAGCGVIGPLEAIPVEKMRRQFEVNVIGVLATTQAILPHFRANKSGFVVNISSMGGRVTMPLSTLYNSSKFAVEGLSEALHYELAAIGVKMKIIQPGAIKTDFGVRSADLNNDPQLTEYQSFVQRVAELTSSIFETAPGPELVAAAIHRAVTDGTDQLRYAVGQDAEQLLAMRNSVDDRTMFAAIKAHFGYT